MKRAVAIILTFVFCMCSALCVGANEEISVIIDGVNQKYDVMPLIISDRTLVPMRAIFETLGAEVFWDETNSMIAAKKGNVAIRMEMNTKKVFVNNEEVILDAPPVIINSRTLVPVRFVSETLGCSVQWKKDTKTVVITTGGNEDEAKKLYNEMNLTDIILDEKTFFSNGALGGKNYGYAEKVEGGVDGYSDVLRVTTTSIPDKTSKFIYRYNGSVEGVGENDSLLLVLTFRTLSSDSSDGTGKIQVQLEETVNFAKAIFEEFTAGREWTTYYMPVSGAYGATATAIRFGFNKQVVEVGEFKYINCKDIPVTGLPNNTYSVISAPKVAEFEQNKDNMDIYICLGQSNMQGAGVISGEDIYDYKSSYLFNSDGKWEYLGYETSKGKTILGFNRHSNLLTRPDGCGLGPLDSMSKILEQKLPGKNIGYVVNALGGISVTTYLPGSQEGYYEKTLERCKEAQKYGTIKGIIWLQGAADVNKPEYINWLGQMVESFKKDLDLSSLPVIAGEILNTFPERVEFNKNLKAAENVIDIKVVSSEGLADCGDKSHLSDDSYREMGRRFAGAILENFYNIKE